MIQPDNVMSRVYDVLRGLQGGVFHRTTITIERVGVVDTVSPGCRSELLRRVIFPKSVTVRDPTPIYNNYGFW